MKFIIAKKAGMSQIFEADGKVIPVTLLEVASNTVTQVKTKESDGYEAVQVGFEATKENRINRPQKGHLGKAGSELVKYLREFKPTDVSAYKPGDKVTVGVFSVGDKVVVRGKSIGRGFQGVVKRHGFSGGPASHGHRHVLRTPGSIGSMFPQRVFKGKRMAGRMGARNVSVKNLEVVRVDEKKNLLFIKGAVPGKKGSLIEVISK